MKSNGLWIALLALGLLSLTALAGYFWTRGTAYGEIEGRVTRGGEPLEHVQVVFYPEKDGLHSWALTNKDGSFEAMTDAILKMPARKGAPVGKYRVVLMDVAEQIRDMEQMERSARATSAPAGTPLHLNLLGLSALPQKKKKNAPTSAVRVPAQYNQRLDTPFHDIEIKSGKNWFDLDVK